jgi:hypothetical protein
MPVNSIDAWMLIAFGVLFMLAPTILYRPLWALNHRWYQTEYFCRRFERSPTLRMLRRIGAWTERKGLIQYSIRAIYFAVGIAALISGLSSLNKI